MGTAGERHLATYGACTAVLTAVRNEAPGKNEEFRYVTQSSHDPFSHDFNHVLSQSTPIPSGQKI